MSCKPSGCKRCRDTGIVDSGKTNRHLKNEVLFNRGIRNDCMNTTLTRQTFLKSGIAVSFSLKLLAAEPRA